MNNWTITAAEAARGLVKERDDLVKAIERAEKKLADERSLLERTRQHRGSLIESSKRTLSGDEADLSYLKFKADVRKNDETICISQEAIKVLETDILPGLRRDLVGAEQQLRQRLDAPCRARKQEIEEAMLTRFADLLATFSDFLAEGEILYGDVGMTFPGLHPQNGFRPYRFLKMIEQFAAADFAVSLQRWREAREREKAAEAPLTVETNNTPAGDADSGMVGNAPAVASTQPERHDLPLEGAAAGGPAVIETPYATEETLLTGVVGAEKKVVGVGESP